MIKYFVSRQHYWGLEDECAYIVEVAKCGLAFAGPDMLGFKWPHLGEGKEFKDPREAAECAINICNEWRKTNPDAKVAYGFSGGFTLPFEPCSYEELQEWAENSYNNLPKCEQCAGILGETTYTNDLVMDDEKFCSQNCAETNYQDQMAERMHSSIEECRAEGDHLLSVDNDGYCIYCREQ